MSITTVERPKQSWEQYVSSLPPSRSITLGGICERWCEFDVIERKDDAGKVVGRDKRSRENGEKRAYLAWAAGAMEPEEERMFGMFSLRTDLLITLAIVPLVRELVQRDERNASIVSSLIDRVDNFNESIGKLERGE